MKTKDLLLKVYTRVRTAWQPVANPVLATRVVLLRSIQSIRYEGYHILPLKKIDTVKDMCTCQASVEAQLYLFSMTRK